MDQIMDHGKVTRAYLGIVVQDVTPAIAKAMGRTNFTARWWETSKPPARPGKPVSREAISFWRSMANRFDSRELRMTFR